MDSPSALPTRDQFFSELNSDFGARMGDDPNIQLTLIDTKVQLSTPSQECFTLLFRAPADLDPRQGLYHLENKTLGEMDIFLVPVDRDTDGLYYEAVFNKMLSAQA